MCSFRIGPEAVAKLQELVDGFVIDPALRSVCFTILADPGFAQAPGSSRNAEGKGHHAYRGGLAAHTLEVTQIALATVRSARMIVDTEVLLVAAIAHDYLKVREYSLDESGAIQKTEYRHLVRHVSGSHAAFVSLCDQNKYTDSPRRMLIEHAILAHHGRQEWGSPMEPETVEAKILHYADMLSSRHGIAKEKQ